VEHKDRAGKGFLLPVIFIHEAGGPIIPRSLPTKVSMTKPEEWLKPGTQVRYGNELGFRINNKGD
jgi:hypothetical protein